MNMSQIPTTLANRVMRALPRHLLCCWLLLATSLVVCGEEEQELSNRQAGVAQRYQQLEELLLRLAEMEVAENPERAGLLQRAARQSRDKFVIEKLKSASDSLKTQQFQQAVENQESANQELKALLTLLMSEDRSKRIRDEKERLTKLDKELKRVLNNQRSARARTENGADLEDVSEEQKAVTERSEELTKQLAEDNKQNSPEDTESESGESGEAQSGKQEQDTNDKPQDNEPKDEQQKDGEKSDKTESKDEQPKDEPKDEDKSDDQSTKPAGGESEQNSGKNPKDSSEQQSPSGQQQGDPQQQQQDSPQGQQQQQQQQSQQQQQDSQPSDQNNQPQTPEQAVEKQLQKAIERMQEAEKQLEESKREQATEQQRQAEENLRAAIDQLERILRQLREEEMERELAKLESRLRKMVAMQTKVLDDTVALAATPASQRSRQTDVKAGDLAFEEKKITMEADRAMLLLREEGSSVAFPEVLSQIRSDTTRVAELLGQTKIDGITQGIQQDILAALDEMIAAVQKAQRDLEKKRQQEQQGQSQPPQQGEQPLVEALAELKLIRTMETRIKSTTDRYSSLLESGETPSAEVLPLVQELSDRQNRLYQITRDLVLKRNK